MKIAHRTEKEKYDNINQRFIEVSWASMKLNRLDDKKKRLYYVRCMVGKTFKGLNHRK